MRKKELGFKGEEEATEYLHSLGYTILDQNWRAGHAEVDIVARTANTLIFCEVKTRNTSTQERPEELIHPNQIKSLEFAANEYVQGLDESDVETRFDLIIIQPNAQIRVKHIPHIFFPEP